MRIKVLNDNILIDPDPNHVVDSNPEISRIVNAGTIILSENNTLIKKSNSGRVISYGSRCRYRYTPGQRIYSKQFASDSVYYEEDGKRYRFLKEWELIAWEENDAS